MPTHITNRIDEGSAAAGRRLKLLRVSKGWNRVEALAEMEKYGPKRDYAWLFRIETCKRNLLPSELEFLARFYGIPIDRLIKC